MSEDQAEYVTEAMTLLRGEPAAIIEQPRERLILRSGLESEQTAAWVKLSTAFKPHIKELRGAPLAVWLYISLCINKSGVAFPSISNIAEETGYSRQGIMDAISTLEDKGYLKVRRGEKKYNLYEPEFAAIGRINEPSGSVNLVDSSETIGQLFTPDRSTFFADESTPLDLNKRNKRELEKEPAAAPPLSDKPKKDAVDFEIDFHLKPKAIKDAFAKYFKLTPNWEAKYNRQFMEWMLQENATPVQIEYAADLWRKDKRFNWTAPSLKGVQEHWFELIENVIAPQGESADDYNARVLQKIKMSLGVST